jgi:hypothetical protein
MNPTPINNRYQEQCTTKVNQGVQNVIFSTGFQNIRIIASESAALRGGRSPDS